MGACVNLDLHRNSDWSLTHVGVLGVGIAGFAAADALMQLGAQVTIIDSFDGDGQQERAGVLGSLGAHVALGVKNLPTTAFTLLVTSPGLKPNHDFHLQAFARGIPIWGELELAWRLRNLDSAAEWLCVTGTNGKTTTTLMLESMLRAAGFRTVSAGNIGNSLVDVVMHDVLDVIAIEVSATQLPFAYSMSPWASVCLNLAEDHVDFFGTFNEYRSAKAQIYERTKYAAVFNDLDQLTIEMVEQADVIEGCRAIGFTRGIPGVGMVGVVDGAIVDRAFITNRRDFAQELALVSDISPPAIHNTENALAAAALARAFGQSDRGDVPPAAIKSGIRQFEPAPHRIQHVREVSGVVYINDSKATNAHAANMSLGSFPSVVWIAGGLAKGQDFQDLVRHNAQRLKAVVLLGQDAGLLAEALSRHAPNVPVFTLATRDTSAMAEAVTKATELAALGDTVLLAPGCASLDMFTDYGHRGRVFTEAVNRIVVE